MVRGLDYYTRTTFEVTCEHLGSQNAVTAGGRYDRLVEDFGGPPTPAIGFAIGMERLTSLYKESSTGKSPTPKIFIATLGDTAAKEGLTIANYLRSQGSWVEIGYAGSSLKSQLRRADRLSSQYVLIIGDDELAQGKAKWKRLDDGTQGEVSLKRIAEDFLAGQSE
jgi:histidyl-tRNA synthetase